MIRVTCTRANVQWLSHILDMNLSTYRSKEVYKLGRARFSLAHVTKAAAATEQPHEPLVGPMITGSVGFSTVCHHNEECSCDCQRRDALTWIRKADCSVLLPLRHCVLALLGLYTIPASYVPAGIGVGGAPASGVAVAKFSAGVSK